MRKTSPSGGGLHPTEAYLLAINVTDLPKGIYQYHANKHGLSLINSFDASNNLSVLFCGQYFVEKLSFGIFLTSQFNRIWHKYPHSRAYRIALYDIGHISQTFQLATTALNLNPWLTGAFIDEKVNELLKLKKSSEQVLFFVGAGHGDGSPLDKVLKNTLAG